MIISAEEAKKLAKQKFQNNIPNAMTIWLDEPVLMLNNIPYEVEHHLVPTDVVNHCTGWPLTTMGADLWTCYGSTKTPIRRN